MLSVVVLGLLAAEVGPDSVWQLRRFSMGKHCLHHVTGHATGMRLFLAALLATVLVARFSSASGVSVAIPGSGSGSGSCGTRRSVPMEQADELVA